ncbi:hypothetical protein [Streptomyces antibioticus]|uniref:Uncharacterized protein n=1 Tax=Streptomyces antibioticus TaxID=1890 RepID=A0AAE6YF68_STRAT|nr:hypothetical protein [Streptomyces antibioticus]OOQ47341.1 hypothetical protein AFM16_31880 [Streptomyces antibioticus]QIT47664.1 hypothetical protein HCX60_32435 [Streptomyces antibioticus]
MTPPEASALAAELANLRGDFANFGRDIGDIKTSCAVLVERSNRTEQDVRDLRKDMEDEVRKVREDEVKPLQAKVDALSSRQWPLQSVAALASATAIGVTVWQAVGR